MAAFNRIGYKERLKGSKRQLGNGGNYDINNGANFLHHSTNSNSQYHPCPFYCSCSCFGFYYGLPDWPGAQFDLNTLFDGFKYIMKAFGLHFLTGLFIFLWSLLFIIPGIVAALRYSMAFHILADNPDIGVMEAIEKSKMMTQGYKLDIFIMYLSFMGWAILSAFTLGIGVLWLAPYISTSFANVYLALKGEETLSASA